MKKIAFILILILFIPTAATAKKVNDSDELLVLASLLHANDLTIEDWKVTVKEKMSREKLQNVINMLKDTHLITTKTNENTVKYIVEDSHKLEEITELYEVIIPLNESLDGELVTVIRGEKWEKSTVHNYREKLDKITEQYFTASAREFTCIQTEEHDIMNVDHFLNDALTSLDLQYVSTQTEKITNRMNKENIYGYTSLWKQKIPLIGNPVNVQIAIKNTENENSKVTVGTPILINEY